MIVNVLFKNAKTKTVVAFFGIGTMISSLGQIEYSLRAFLDYYNIENLGAKETVVWVGAISTLYIRAMTRFPALWKQFSATQKSNEKPLSKKQKILLASIMATGIVSGFSNSLQAYLGGSTFLEMFWAEEKYVDYVLGVYASLSGLISYFAFFVQNAVQNTKSLTELEVGKDIRSNKMGIILNLTKTAIVSCFGTAALGAFAFFTVDGLIQNLPRSIKDELPEYVEMLVPTVALTSTIVTTLLSRIAETYKYFAIEKPLSLERLTVKQKLKETPGIVLSLVDLVIFAITLYISCIDVAKSYHIDDEPILTIIVSILAALSGAFLHYVFSVRRVLKVNLQSAREKAEPVESNKSDLREADSDSAAKNGMSSREENSDFSETNVSMKSIQAGDSDSEDGIQQENCIHRLVRKIGIFPSAADEERSLLLNDNNIHPKKPSRCLIS